ncbi:hypothetical protein HK100_007221, partial [Physocladia obscura]
RTTATGTLIDAYLSEHKNGNGLDDRTVHLLFAANRAESMRKLKEILLDGTTVIIDRYAFSGVAYTFAKGNKDLQLEWCKNVDAGIIKPDLVLFLDIPTKDASERGEYGRERYEKLEFQEKVRSCFLSLVDESYWRVIDARQSKGALGQEIRKIVDETVNKAADAELAGDNAKVADLVRQIGLFQRSAGPSNAITDADKALLPPLPGADLQSDLAPSQSQVEEHDNLFFDDLAKDIRLRSFAAGDVILQEGEPAKCIFFVFRGAVEVVSADGELVLAVLDQGSFFGEIAVLFDTPRVATVKCLIKCLVGVLTASDLHIHLAKYPKMKETVMNEAKERYARSKAQLENNGRSMQKDSLLERQFSMVDIGRSLSPKSAESPSLSSGRRASSLGQTSMINIFKEVSSSLANVKVDAQDETDDEYESISDESTDRVDYVKIANVPCISIDSEFEPRRTIAKQSSEGCDVDHNNNIAALAAINVHPSGLEIPSMNSYVSSLALLHTSKRRASVAVWSDDRLMQMAQNATEKGTPKSSTATVPGRGTSTLSNTKTDPINYDSDSKSEISLVYQPSLTDEKPILNPFSNYITATIFSHFDFKTLMRLRILSHSVLSFLEDSHLHVLLESVDLSPWHKKIDDSLLYNILQFSGHNIRALNLRNCWQLTDKGLAHIAAHAPRLQYINLSSVWDVTDSGVAALAKLTTSLHSIDLSNCRKLTDSAVQAVLAFSPELAAIQLSYCKNLTDVVMDHPTWTGVRSVNMQRCTAISDAGFAMWAAKSLKFALKELVLSDCSFLTDAAVANIAACCGELEVLSLSFCCALTEACFGSLTPADCGIGGGGGGCGELRVLDVSFCGGAVTDGVLLALARGLKKLERLSVRGCVQVTDVGVNHLKDYARLLKVVNLTQCRNIKILGDELVKLGWTLLIGGELVTDYGFKSEKYTGEHTKNMNMRHSRALTT